MKNAPILRSIADDEDLAAKREEVLRLSQLLAEREMELAEWQSALSRFHYRYFHFVGSRYVQLDQLLAKIARIRADRRPDNEEYAHEARYRRFHAERSAGEYRQFRDEVPPEAEAKESIGAPAKKLYREIAVQIHPDRAEDEGARHIRTALMAELNAAYGRGDIDRMKAILEEWRTSPEAVTGEDDKSELERLCRIVYRLERRIRRVEKEIRLMTESAPGRLLRRTQEAEKTGRDLLGELADEIDLKIRQAREELEEEARRSYDDNG